MTQSDLDTVRRIILSGIGKRKARVFLFGLRATDKTRDTSDIDVAVLPLERFPQGLLSEIRFSLHESNVPYEVDLVDLSHADQEFRRHVIEEGMLWKDSGFPTVWNGEQRPDCK